MPKNEAAKIDDFFDDAIATAKRARMLTRIQMVMVIICWGALIPAILIKILGGGSSLVFWLGIVGMLFGFFSWVVGRIAKPIVAKAEANQKIVDEVVSDPRYQRKKPVASVIPLTIGFANLSGDDLGEIAAEDASRLSPLFARSELVADYQIPSSEVLFIYAHLDDDGSFKGSTPSNIRQIIQLTKAAIVVLASPNSGESIKIATALPGPKTANIVFTLDRNSDGFSQFFYDLFEKMRDGTDMLSAWVEIAPQNPNANPQHAPQTILLAEGGKIAFPH